MGTNAHLILEEAPVPAPAEAPVEASESTGGRGPRPSMVPWVISARSAEALTAQAGRLMAHVQANPGLDPIDVGCSLASRSVFEHRAVVVGASREQLIAGLAGLAAGEPGAGVAVGQPGSVGKTVVVFPGQGAQRIGMGRELYGELPVFAQAFDAVADELDRHLRLPLRDVIWGADADLLDSTEFAQPALFAVEVASFAVLRDWGVLPDFVMGHSVGELAAAHAAGVLTLADAAMLVVARGRLMQALPAGGAMVAVAASEDEVEPLLGEGVGIAAINAPRIGGDLRCAGRGKCDCGSVRRAGSAGAPVGGLACVSFAVDGADARGVRACRGPGAGTRAPAWAGVERDGRVGRP